MKVRELIEALSKEDQDKSVYIHDADTAWLLPVQLGRNYEGRWDVMPPDIVIIHGEYHSEGMISKFEKEP